MVLVEKPPLSLVLIGDRQHNETNIMIISLDLFIFGKFG